MKNETKYFITLMMIVAVVFLVTVFYGCSSLETNVKKSELLVWSQYQLIQIEIEVLVVDPETDPDLKQRLIDLDRIAVRTLEQYSAGVQTFEAATRIVEQAIETFSAIKPVPEPAVSTFYYDTRPAPMPQPEHWEFIPDVYPDVIIYGTDSYQWEGRGLWDLKNF